jgi:hypothetical protein
MKFAVKSGLLSIALAAAFVHAQTFPTPIQHVIIIVQENRTPDNLFEDPTLMNNGADIQMAPSNPPAVPLGSCWDIGHSHGYPKPGAWETEYADQQNGRGFCDDSINHKNCTSWPSCPEDTYVENTSQDNATWPT